MAAERERLFFIGGSRLPTEVEISALCTAGGKEDIKAKMMATGNSWLLSPPYE